MEITQLAIEGVFEITPILFEDERGSFEKKFDASLYEKYGMNINIREVFSSISHKNVIRGMHFQTPPFECSKYVSVISGIVLDVILDLRMKSKTYGKFIAVTLDSEKRNIIYIPDGCAHGFLSLSDFTQMNYLQTMSFSKENDSGIHFDSFGMDWGLSTEPIVSYKDRNLPTLSNFNSPF